MPVRSLPKFIALGICLAGAGALQAADNTLYDAPPPEDAAFLRWIEPGLAPEIYGIAALGAEGDVFHPVSAAATEGAQAGVYYTAARDAEGTLVVIEEPARPDRTKVQLTLVNLAEAPVRLEVAGQDMVVVGETATGTAAARAVNPVAVALTVVTADGAALGQFEVRLRRGQNLTFVARAEGAELIANRFGPTLAE
ncbi:alginate O-acetyltransferase AlgF [Dinoroseobacter sp. S76]|uniref:alginate O-acetyltransferase AlgF n=1 Tax=Dinoroseobacter sp. S76 TaxID=3415124 RepID=UPI003C79E460